MALGDVALVDDAQRGDELVAEIGLPAADAGERPGGLDHRIGAAGAAVVGLDAPDGGDDIRIDAIGPPHRLEHLGVLGHGLAAAADARLRHQHGHVVARRAAELRLRLQLVHDAHVGLQPGRVAAEAGGGDAGLARLRLQRGDAAAEIRLVAGERGRRHVGMGRGRRSRPRRRRPGSRGAGRRRGIGALPARGRRERSGDVVGAGATGEAEADQHQAGNAAGRVPAEDRTRTHDAYPNAIPGHD